MKETRAYCNKCCGERNHKILHEETTTWEEEVDHQVFIHGGDSYEMIRCCGCEQVGMRHRNWFSEDLNEHGGPAVNTTYYPPATFRREPAWLSDLMISLPINDQSVHDLFKEVYSALRNNSHRLPVMGIRAILEHVMIEKVSDKGTFKGNLDEFESQGYVSKSQRRVLEAVLEAGHATMHRALKPSRDDLVALMDITENIIESIYINDLRTASISDRVPPRKSGGS